MGNYWWYVTVLLRNEAAAPAENEEILYSAAELSGSIGTELQELPDGARMRLYYRSDEELSYWRNKLLDALEPWPVVKVEDLGKIENQQWSRQSEEAFPPLGVGRGLVVLAPWHKGKEPDGRIPIYINPGSAFGTGYHESTQAALELLEFVLEKHGFNGGEVMDVGAGSGILTIAAIKLGADRVRSRDIDPAVIEEVKGNLELNGIDPAMVTLETGDLMYGVDGRFGLIFANILLDPLLEMLPQVRDRLAPGGIAIFSGMTLKERGMFMSELADMGLSVVGEMAKEEWWGVAAQSPA
ncbi:MAG: 50S ribosomal protein L11 methyltransferase [Synergistaceae bacterium]|jgi:ribosomal protein L11 methyltransferase|nr:50S ribosomal protein L11 methyltransferase [Synergistaceae bacterium]